MGFLYNNLWKTLNEKGISIKQFENESGISSSTLNKLKNNNNVSMEILDKICKYLKCNLSDIVSHYEESFDKNKLFYEPCFPVKTSLKTVSLFSGTGGLDLGLMESGFDIIFANDNYKPAVDNYKHNIGDIVEKDIRELDINLIPECDVIVGGFPCQPFSSAGNRLGIDDERGNLFLDIIKIIQEKDPKVVIMENVRGLLSMKNKDDSKLIDTIVSLLEESGQGYNVKYKLLRASDYGVPQERYRVFIIAFRNDLNINYDFPEPYMIDKDQLTLKYVLDIPENVNNKNEVWDLSPQSQHLVKFIPQGGSWKDVPYGELPDRLKRIRNNMKRYHSPNFYRRYSLQEINGTITAAATPENCGIIHPLEDRRYSVREVARIQSFPDSYEFIGPSTQSKYKLIGNAVPPKLGKAIGDSIIEHLYMNGY